MSKNRSDKRNKKFWKFIEQSKSIDYVENSELTMWEIQMDFGNCDIMYSPEYHKNIALPNYIPTLLKPYCIYPCNNDITEIKITNEQESITNFNEGYKDFILYLKNRTVGYDIKFGLVIFN